MSEHTPNPEPSPVTTPPATSQDSKNFALLAHLLGIFTAFIGALVIWLVKKESDAFVEDQAKEALNFQIAVAIAYIIAYVLTVILIGAILLPVIWVANVIFCLLGTIQASKGEAYRYPFTLRLIK